MEYQKKAKQLLEIMPRREVLILCLEVISALNIPNKIAYQRAEYWQKIHDYVNNKQHHANNQ